MIKPRQTVLAPFHRDDVIRVKFLDDGPVRLRDGALTDFGTGELDEARDTLQMLAGAVWRPMMAAPEVDIEALRQQAQANLGKAVADFRVWFHVFLPEHVDAAGAIDSLNRLECIELAEPVQDATVPTMQTFGALQSYLNAGPIGVGALPAWDFLGTGARGINVNVVDIEFGWEIFHQDLPTVNLMQFGDPPQSQAEEDHGTATLGVLGAVDNGWGTTGIAPDAILGFTPVRVGGLVNIPNAIAVTALNTQPGDIILIELQIAGPATCSDPCTPMGLPPCSCGGSFAWVPVEWGLAEYNAIVAAVGAGRVVIEPAGNGAQDLDAAIYQTGHNPFQNDSGAIMVGAGMPPMMYGGLDLDRSRVCCSNYGSRLDVQGWGWSVTTTGYGDYFADANGQLNYTGTFAGTSSASATIAGAAALVQSAYKWANNSNILAPGALRQVLIDSGSPQQSAILNNLPASQTIGPRPDAAFAILLTVGGCMPLWDTAIGNPGLDGSVEALASFNDGSGNKLFAGGFFSNAGGVSAGLVAAWDGTNWSAVGGSPAVGFIRSLEVHDDGSGYALFTGGGNGVAKWDGSTWTTLGGLFNGEVMELEVYNGDLYAGGWFTSIGGVTMNRIARWNGSSWSSVGGGTDAIVSALLAHNDGNGYALFVGGDFTTAGSTSASRVAKWNGSSWSAVGGGFASSVESFGTFNGDLYAGGFFSIPVDPFNRIARWDGTQWSGLNDTYGRWNSMSNTIYAMTEFDDGTGNALFVAGVFEQADDAAARGVAKYDGTRWWPLGDGLSLGTLALQVHDEGNGLDLFAAGGFLAAWDLPATRAVKWNTCAAAVCLGNADGDNQVGINDFLAVLGSWGPCPEPCPPCAADFDNDCVVGINDFLIVLGNWGSCP